MALDCEKAFSQEMAVLNSIDTTQKQILTILQAPATPQDSSELKAALDETNRLLKLLCKNLIGQE